MRSGKCQVVIEASGTRLLVAIIRDGRVSEHRVEWFAAGDWASTWPGGLASRREALAGMIEALGVLGHDATIVYHAPTTVGGMFSCPAAAGLRGAERAAALALAELSGHGVGKQPTSSQRASVDHAGADATSSPLQRHTLSVTDRLSSTEAVAAWAAAAGLRPIAVTPAIAPMLLAGVALTARIEAQAKLGLWLGEHESVLAASLGGRLLFVRTLALGTEAMVEALGRPIRIRGEEAREPVVLNSEEARQLLFRVGIPNPEDVVDARRGLIGSTVLPLLQPVLQRFAVELKQSVRFGLPDSAREGATLVIAGVGALVPALGRAVAAPCGLVLAPSIEQEIVSDRVPIALALPGSTGCQISLLPASFERQETIRRVRTGLRLGMAACLVMIGISASLSWMSLRQARAAAAAVADSDPVAAQGALVQRDAARLAAARELIQRRIDAEVGALPPLSGALSLIAEIAPEGLELSAIEIRPGEPLVSAEGVKTGDRGPTPIRLTGIVRDSAPQGLAKTLRTFTDALSSAPIITSVRLGGTHRAEQGQEPVSRFELMLSTLGLPPEVPLASASKGQP